MGAPKLGLMDEWFSSVKDRQLVLVVDDDPRIRQSLESLLRSAGYQVNLYGSATHLLMDAALQRARCVITDIRMPAMDGWELQRCVAVTYPDLPLIFLTAYYEDSAMGRAFANGAFGFFYKPFDAELLLQTVQAALLSRQSDPGNAASASH